MSLGTRLAVWASVFLAGVILAIAFPIVPAASQTVEPTPTPDPQPDPSPAQPSVGSAVGSSGSSSGSSAPTGSSGSTAPSFASDGGGNAAPSSRQRKPRSNLKEQATPAAAQARHVGDPRASLGPPLLIGGGASPSLLYLEMLLLTLAGALALMLTLTIRVSSNRLAGLSNGLAEQRAHAAALIAVLLLAVIVGLLVVHLVGQA